jgi:hypothetical protein
MNLQQQESRMFGHEPTVRSFSPISHRFLAKPAAFGRISRPLPCIRRLSSPFRLNFKLFEQARAAPLRAGRRDIYHSHARSGIAA